MLDYFAIFSRGGALLWTLQFTALRHNPLDAINALVRSCLLEERSSEAAFTYTPKAGAAQSLKWTFHNVGAVVDGWCRGHHGTCEVQNYVPRAWALYVRRAASSAAPKCAYENAFAYASPHYVSALIGRLRHGQLAPANAQISTCMPHQGTPNRAQLAAKTLLRHKQSSAA